MDHHDYDWLSYIYIDIRHVIEYCKVAVNSLSKQRLIPTLYFKRLSKNCEKICNYHITPFDPLYVAIPMIVSNKCDDDYIEIEEHYTGMTYLSETGMFGSVVRVDARKILQDTTYEPVTIYTLFSEAIDYLDLTITETQKYQEDANNLRDVPKIPNYKSIMVYMHQTRNKLRMLLNKNMNY